MTEKREINLEHPAYPKYATVYSEKDTDAKACILYFHGGGLLYGSREDLPRRHIDTLTRAGYIIVSYDYPLAPAARLDTIMGDVCSSITHYINHPEIYCGRKLPFFLWGRSAGAYLCLLAGAKGNLPAGSSPTTDTDSCATTGMRHPADFTAPFRPWMRPAWNRPVLTSTRPEAWTPTTAFMYMQDRPDPGVPFCMKAGINISIWTTPCAPAPPFPAPFSALTAPVTMMCPTGNSWSCQTVSAHGSSSPPAMATTLTGMRKTRLRKNCWTRHWHSWRRT